MSFQATLQIEDKTFNIISFKYASGRDHDRTGRVSSEMLGIRIDLLLEAKPETVLLHMWANTNYDVKSGTITFKQRNSDQKQAEFKFEEGYIVDIMLDFSNIGEAPLTERVVIYANKMEYSSQGFMAANEMFWPA